MMIPVYCYTIAVLCFIFIYLVLLLNPTHSKIDWALSSLPTFSFPEINLLEPVKLQSCFFQHGRLWLRFQFGDKHKGKKSDL